MSILEKLRILFVSPCCLEHTQPYSWSGCFLENSECWYNDNDGNDYWKIVQLDQEVSPKDACAIRTAESEWDDREILGNFCVWATGGTGTVAWDASAIRRDTAWNPAQNLAGWIALGDGRGDLKGFTTVYLLRCHTQKNQSRPCSECPDRRWFLFDPWVHAFGTVMRCYEVLIFAIVIISLWFWWHVWKKSNASNGCLACLSVPRPFLEWTSERGASKISSGSRRSPSLWASVVNLLCNDENRSWIWKRNGTETE